MCIDYSVIKVNTLITQGDWNFGIEKGLSECTSLFYIGRVITRTWRTGFTPVISSLQDKGFHFFLNEL